MLSLLSSDFQMGRAMGFVDEKVLKNTALGFSVGRKALIKKGELRQPV